MSIIQAPPLFGAEVNIYNRLYEGKTNSNGVYTSRDLLKGEYIVSAVYKNNISYANIKSILIFEGENNEIVLNLFENKQKVTLTLLAYHGGELRTNVNISILEISYSSFSEFSTWFYRISFKGIIIVVVKLFSMKYHTSGKTILYSLLY